jgi:succinoglycan biosynthesis protein ExoO
VSAALPRVSVIIPAYRAAATIHRAVASALGQQGVAVDVIVVDDASADETAAVLQSAFGSDSRLRVTVLPVNGGVSRARNLAMAQAQGDWLAFLDADDWMTPNRLRVLIDHAVAARLPMVADTQFLCAGDVQKPEAIRLAGVVPAGTCAEVTPDMFLRRNLAVIKPVVDRQWLGKTGICFDESLRCGEDLVFILALLLQGGRLALLDRPMYFKHQIPTSITASDRSGALLATCDVLSGLVPLVQSSALPPAARTAILAALAYSLRTQRDALAFERIRSALRRFPSGGGVSAGDFVAAVRHLLMRRYRFPKVMLSPAEAAAVAVRLSAEQSPAHA